MSTVERLEVDVQRYSRAVPSDAVGLRARVTALDARGQKLGAALTASEVVVVDETGLRLPVERRLATADELARYAPPGFEGSMAYAGVPSRTDLAPDPIEPYDQSDREEDVPGAIVTEANDDLRVEGVSR